jgi:hypothetical protein
MAKFLKVARSFDGTLGSDPQHEDQFNSMAVGSFDFWDKEWPVITGAPHIVLGGLFILVVAIFLLVRWAYSREIAGLKAESGALNERLPSNLMILWCGWLSIEKGRCLVWIE